MISPNLLLAKVTIKVCDVSAMRVLFAHVVAAGKRFYYSSATTNILTAALRNSFDDTEEFANFPRNEL
jgi:hypothetical protein